MRIFCPLGLLAVHVPPPQACAVTAMETQDALTPLCSQPRLQPVRPLLGLIPNSIWAVHHPPRLRYQASPRALCQGTGERDPGPSGALWPKTRVLRLLRRRCSISPWAPPGHRRASILIFSLISPGAQESKAASWAVSQQKVSTCGGRNPQSGAQSMAPSPDISPGLRRDGRQYCQ